MKKDNTQKERKGRFGLFCLVAAAAGLLTALPFNVDATALIGWVSAAPLVCVLLLLDKHHHRPLRRAYVLALCYFGAFYLGVYFWFLYMYPLSFTGLSRGGALAVVCAGWIGLSLLQAAVFSLIGPFFILLRRKKLLHDHRPLLALTFPAMWVVFEWLQSVTWAGVPFARLAVGQRALLPVIQSASLLGSLFVVFLMVTVGSFTAFAVRYVDRRVFCGVLAVAVLGVNFSYGCLALLVDREIAEPITAAALQGNISSVDKWESMTCDEICDTYLALCEDAAEAGARLLVIPESAVPAYFNLDGARLDRFRTLARDYGATVLLGGFWKAEDATYNAVYCINPDGSVGETPYFKRRLVPFGEYVPMRAFFETVFPPLTQINMLEEDDGQGTDSNLHDSVCDKIGSLICFDSIYDTLARDSVQDGAALLAVSTNDSWFFDSPALDEHLGHAVLRAVENGRYVVRAGNTGISALIAPTGRVLDRLPAQTAGYVSATVYPRTGRTLYTRVGNVLVPVCGVFVLVLLVLPGCGKEHERRRQRRETPAEA